MSKKILEYSLSIFLVLCGISMLVGVHSLKLVLDSNRLLADETRKNQQQMVQTVTEVKDIVYEVIFAAGVIAMSEERMMSPADADKMLEESVRTIQSNSEKLGKLARYINNFRINQQRKR